jgi:SAM-dependent methyltransferase
MVRAGSLRHIKIHQAAAEGFQQGADAYERGRPGYPQAAIDWLLGKVAVGPASTIIDLGAGTGKFTRLLQPAGARIVAIEPVAGMREQFMKAVPGIQILDGTAEGIPLSSGTADVVTAAQSFHWFATPAALAEIHRVLGEDGWLVLIWNRRDLADPLQAALDLIVSPHRGEAPAHEWDRWRGVMAESSLFRPAGEARFRLEQQANQQGVIDRVTSTSFIASLDEAARNQIIERVRELVPDSTAVVLPYVTDVFLFRRK